MQTLIAFTIGAACAFAVGWITGQARAAREEAEEIKRTIRKDACFEPDYTRPCPLCGAPPGTRHFTTCPTWAQFPEERPPFDEPPDLECGACGTMHPADGNPCPRCAEEFGRDNDNNSKI